MRTKVTSSIVLCVVLAVCLFAVPLAFAFERLYQEQVADRLAREASRAAAEVPVDTSALAKVTLPAPLSSQTRLGLYNTAGVLLAGTGPKIAPAAGTVASTAVTYRQRRGDEVVVIVPVRIEGGGTSVRASAPTSEVFHRAEFAFLGMLALGVTVLTIATLLARRRAASIAAPLEQLTHDATALGTGDFSIRARDTGLREANEASLALQATATRLGRLLERERTFNADASHQMRTPLTALRLGLEAAMITPGADLEQTVREALRRIDRVDATLDEILALRQGTPSTGPFDVVALLQAGMKSRWRPLAEAGERDIRLVIDPSLPIGIGSGPVVDQVVDVLVSNALRHGRGLVTLTARAGGTGVAIEVSDQGPGVSAEIQRSIFTRLPAGAFAHRDPTAGAGIGLALARDLAEAAGCRLVLTHPGPEPVFTLVLPAAQETADPELTASDPLPAVAPPVREVFR